MKYLVQFGIIIGITFAGEVLNYLIPAPVPASIYGLLILLALLLTRVLKVHHVKETSDFLITIMPIMFVPPAIGLMESWGVIAGNLPQLLTLLFVSTAIVMAVTGVIVQALARKRGGAEK